MSASGPPRVSVRRRMSEVWLHDYGLGRVVEGIL